VNDYFSEPDADLFYGPINGPIYADLFGRLRTPNIRRFADTVLVADVNSQGGYEYAGYRLSNWAGDPSSYDSLATYHAGGSNILWADGHANTRKLEAMNANDFDRRF
jgi:prepilin-type processing-associated H-X9-DG protein